MGQPFCPELAVALFPRDGGRDTVHVALVAEVDSEDPTVALCEIDVPSASDISPT